jgi:hypothetical protein
VSRFFRRIVLCGKRPVILRHLIFAGLVSIDFAQTGCFVQIPPESRNLSISIFIPVESDPQISSVAWNGRK